MSEVRRSVAGMEESLMRMPAGEVLAAVRGLLDRLDPQVGLMPDAEQLALVAESHRLAGRLTAVAATLAAGVAASEVADRHVGIPLASWLATSEQMTRREGHRLIGQGRDLTRFARVGDAAVAGDIGYEQAMAIAGVLSRLPDDFATPQVAEAEAALLGYAAEFDSASLSRLTHRMVELLDPVGCQEREAELLERDLKMAKAARGLSFASDGHGSVLFKGSLPKLDAEPFMKLIDAYVAEQKAALDRLDPLATPPTPAQRRADALCALIAHHQQESTAPTSGGDRPRVVVVLDHDKLRAACVAGGLLATDEPITAGELRRLACDADVLPAVLGGGSEILDVGRQRRLVTPPIRMALDLRDRGCVFPGCDKPPHACHAHHPTPWWAGGSTSLRNLALVCPHHHNLVEPSRDGPPGERWEIRIAADGTPETLPPVRVDRDRTPRRHQRHRTLS